MFYREAGNGMGVFDAAEMFSQPVSGIERSELVGDDTQWPGRALPRSSCRESVEYDNEATENGRCSVLGRVV
jgi:hypothetical protein